MRKIRTLASPMTIAKKNVKNSEVECHSQWHDKTNPQPEAYTQLQHLSTQIMWIIWQMQNHVTVRHEDITKQLKPANIKEGNERLPVNQP